MRSLSTRSAVSNAARGAMTNSIPTHEFCTSQAVPMACAHKRTNSTPLSLKGFLARLQTQIAGMRRFGNNECCDSRLDLLKRFDLALGHQGDVQTPCQPSGARGRPVDFS